MEREEVLNSLKNIYDESYSTEDEIEIFNLLVNLSEKFNINKEFIGYVVGQEF